MQSPVNVISLSDIISAIFLTAQKIDKVHISVLNEAPMRGQSSKKIIDGNRHYTFAARECRVAYVVEKSGARVMIKPGDRPKAQVLQYAS